MRLPSREFWSNRRVFVTGHTGFKGAWLVMLMHRLGANVTGFALPEPVTEVSLFETAGLSELCSDQRGDIRDLGSLRPALQTARPEILFHMAAQPIVRTGLTDPIGTFDTNVMGTVNVLEAARSLPDLAVFVSVTSDKCYDNLEHVWPYRESDAMGGSDPYSASKGCAELVTAAYAKTFYGQNRARIVSGRAGNVIGGGDWADHRLIPDLVYAMENAERVQVRSPTSIRPWQFVLDPLIGYLIAAEQAFGGDIVHDAWNFGPNAGEELSVREVVETFQSFCDGSPVADFAEPENDIAPRHQEAGLLRVDTTKAKALLGWRPMLDGRGAIEYSAAWYRSFSQGQSARNLSFAQINALAGF